MKSKILALIELDKLEPDLYLKVRDEANCVYLVDEEKIKDFTIAIDKIHDEDEY